MDDLDKSFNFVYAVPVCSHLQCFQIFFTFLHFSQELLVWSWSNFDFCSCCGIVQLIVKFHKFSQFFAFFSGTTGLILIKLWFLFMLWHSAATCNVSKFPSLFCIFLKNYWSHLHQTLIFVHAVAFYSQLQSFTNFLSFWHFSWRTTDLILIKLSFLFMLCHSAANCKVSKFSHFFAFFWRTTGLIFIKHWFLFMLLHSTASCKVSQIFSLFWHFSQELLVLILIKHLFLLMLCHSAANCKVSKFSSLFCIFLKNYWFDLHQTLIFCSCCGILQPLAMFPNFLHFFAFFSGTTGLILINLWFLFMLWHCATQLQSFIIFSVFCIFLRKYWSDFDQTLIFVHAVALCSHLQCFQISFTFLHFSEELLVFIKHWFLFMLWHSAATCKVSQISQFLAFFLRNYWIWSWSSLSFLFMPLATLQPIVKFPNFLHFFAYFSGTIGVILIKLLFLFMLCHSAANCKVSKFFHFFAFFLKNYWFDLDQTFIFVYAVAFCSQL